MNRRTVSVALAVVLLVSLLAPATLSAATTTSGTDAVVSTGSAADASTLDRLRAVVASTGLSRADVDDVLDQPTRAAIFDAIETSPGSTLTALAGVVGVAPSTVRYHVRRLRDAGLVDATELGGSTRFAPAGVDVDLAAALSEPSTAAVLDAVSRHEPASVTAIAADTERAPSTVSHHLSNLECRGLVERERVGEAVLTSLAPSVRDAIDAGDGGRTVDEIPAAD